MSDGGRPGGRGADMQESVARVARAHGVPAPEVAMVARAHALAMEARAPGLADEEHPLYLHPGRTVLVLLRDAGLRRGPALAAAALAESRYPSLRAEPSRVAEALPHEAVALWRALPEHDDPGLVEALVTAGEELRLVALADHLDHLRHLHMLPGRDDWPDLVKGVEEVWGPVAERTHPEMARRYRLWLRTFRRRLRPKE